MWTNDMATSTRDRIEKGRQLLFDFDYPIFDEAYKAVFETNFIRRFYMKEIGFETEGLFKFQLETWLLINMPYFNKMFESELLEFDPFSNAKMTQNYTKTGNKDGTVEVSRDETRDRTNSQDVNGTTSENDFRRTIDNDTPDSRLAITTAEGSGIIEYASHITEDKDNRTTSNDINTSGSSKDTSNLDGTTKTDVTDTETFVQSRVGKTGSQSYSKMLQEYRETLLRIENKMFNEMKQLFMLVY